MTAYYRFDCSYKKLNIQKKNGRRSVIVLNGWLSERQNMSHTGGIIFGRENINYSLVLILANKCYYIKQQIQRKVVFWNTGRTLSFQVHTQRYAILFQKLFSKTQMISLFEWKLCCFEYYEVDLGIWVSKKKRKNNRNFKQRKDYKYQRWWGQRNLTQVPWEYYKIKMPWTDSKHKHAYMKYLTDSVRPTAKWRNEVR